MVGADAFLVVFSVLASAQARPPAAFKPLIEQRHDPKHSTDLLIFKYPPVML